MGKQAELIRIVLEGSVRKAAGQSIWRARAKLVAASAAIAAMRRLVKRRIKLQLAAFWRTRL
jgi:hypothetical protein